MKTQTLLQFVSLFALVISGCEDSDINNPFEIPQKPTIAARQVTVETKTVVDVKPTPTPQQPKQKLKPKPKQKPKPKPKVDPKPIEQNPVLPVLDLGIPKQSQTLPTKDSSKHQEQEYLPDLFNNKNNTNNTIQIDGKTLKKEEEAVEKESVVDGLGIDFTLTP